jgi:Helix-turn-helix domain
LISRLERGERTKTRWRTIARLARALNLEPHELEPILPEERPA